MTRLKTLLAAAATLAITAGAHASTMSVYQAGSYGPAPTVFNSPYLNFNAFDTTLGTLTSVEFNINNQQSVYTSSVTNTGQQTINDKESVYTAIALTGATSNAPSSLNQTFNTPTVTFTISNLAPGQTVNFPSVTQGTYNATYYATDLADFTNGAFELASDRLLADLLHVRRQRDDQQQRHRAGRHQPRIRLHPGRGEGSRRPRARQPRPPRRRPARRRPRPPPPRLITP